MRCTAAMIVSLALGALLCADAYAQAVPVPLERHTGNDYSEAFKESDAKIRELIPRRLRGEDVCSEKLAPYVHNFVCTPEGIFKWADPDFKPGRGCRRCAGYLNSFAYEMCAQGRIKRGPGSIVLDPC